MDTAHHPLKPEHLPSYLAAADGSDHLLTVMVWFVVGLVLLIGVGYFTLHALPERMAHAGSAAQLQLVSILAILALFTHNGVFWVLALLLAAFRPPDIVTPLTSIAQSLAAIAGNRPPPEADPAPVPEAEATHGATPEVATKERASDV